MTVNVPFELREKGVNPFARKKDRRKTKKRICAFCVDKVEHIDYKEIGKLRRFLTERGKILPRRISGNCAGHQRQVTLAIKRARQVALLPYTTE